MRRATVVAIALVLGGGLCEPEQAPSPDAAPLIDDGGDGFDDPVGSGVCFFTDSFELSLPGDGLDLDGDGAIDTTVNAAFEREVDYFNAQFRRTVESGSFLSVNEIAGLTEGYAGEDDAVSLKFYRAHDADDDLSNNDCLEPGCGRMVTYPDDLIDGQTPYRSTPTPIRDTRATGPIAATFYLKVGDQVVPIKQTVLDLALPPALHAIEDMLLCGAATAQGLDFVPLCEILPDPCPPIIPPGLTLSATIRERGFQPDIDLDGDGLETFEIDPATYDVTSCHDPDVGEIEGPACLLDPEMADGFSICFRMHGIPGELTLVP